MQRWHCDGCGLKCKAEKKTHPEYCLENGRHNLYHWYPDEERINGKILYEGEITVRGENCELIKVHGIYYLDYEHARKRVEFKMEVEELQPSMKIDNLSCDTRFLVYLGGFIIETYWTEYHPIKDRGEVKFILEEWDLLSEGQEKEWIKTHVKKPTLN